MIEFTPMRSPCRDCPHSGLDKELDPICSSCKTIISFNRQIDMFEAGVTGIDLDYVASGGVPKKRPPKLCRLCKKVKPKYGETLCASCRKSITKCKVCGQLGVYSLDMCWPHYYEFIRERELCKKYGEPIKRTKRKPRTKALSF